MNYTPHTEEDIARALRKIGVDSVQQLFEEIPAQLLDPAIELSQGLDETALLAHMSSLAAANANASTTMGGGAAKHFIPSAVKQLASQSEFVTAYTPYQPEVSQGILQATFEYQTMISELTALPVSNASMYDGASATAEAALLAVRQTGRRKVAVSRGVNPETREVLATYLSPLEIEVATVELGERLRTGHAKIGEDVAALIVQNPNFLGYLEEMESLAGSAHDAGALFIAVADPLSLALLRPPGTYRADIAVGDGQSLGNPLNFGGPHFGYMAVTEPLLRQLPGRIVGETRDVDGRRAYVLTLQAREQHIRRSRAKSNICSNHQLTALMAAINMAALGPAGIREVATGSVAAAHALADELAAAGYRVERRPRFFNEFVLPVRDESVNVRRELAAQGVQAGVPIPEEYGLGNALLMSATELTTTEERQELIRAMQVVMPTEVAQGGLR